jgi:hypothetical protein
MDVGMRLAAVPFRTVCVTVMLVVAMLVFVFYCYVSMQMLVALGQMQPDTDGHEDP